MKKSPATIAAVAAIAILGLASAVSADEAKGTVKDVNVQSREITLEDGTTYRVGQGIALEDLQPGAEVTISFQQQDGQRWANSVSMQK